MPENEGFAKNVFYSPYCCVAPLFWRKKHYPRKASTCSQCTVRLFLRTHGSVAVGDVRQGLGHLRSIQASAGIS